MRSVALVVELLVAAQLGDSERGSWTTDADALIQRLVARPAAQKLGGPRSALARVRLTLAAALEI